MYMCYLHHNLPEEEGAVQSERLVLSSLTTHVDPVLPVLCDRTPITKQSTTEISQRPQCAVDQSDLSKLYNIKVCLSSQVQLQNSHAVAH